jgi:hypothetical protein
MARYLVRHRDFNFTFLLSLSGIIAASDNDVILLTAV